MLRSPLSETIAQIFEFQMAIQILETRRGPSKKTSASPSGGVHPHYRSSNRAHGQRAFERESWERVQATLLEIGSSDSDVHQLKRGVVDRSSGCRSIALPNGEVFYDANLRPMGQWFSLA